jgi:hypothetical protein
LNTRPCLSMGSHEWQYFGCMQCGVECITFYRGVQALSVGLNVKVFTKAFKLYVWGWVQKLLQRCSSSQCGVEYKSFYKGVQALNVGFNVKLLHMCSSSQCGVECRSFYIGIQVLSVKLNVKTFAKAFKLSWSWRCNVWLVLHWDNVCKEKTTFSLLYVFTF